MAKSGVPVSTPSGAARQLPQGGAFALCRKLYRYHPKPSSGTDAPPLGGELSRKRQSGTQAMAAPPLPQEAGAADAVYRYGPAREKANRENPQIFPIRK